MKNDKLLEFVPCPNSPFVIVKADDKYFVACANYRISEMFNTFDEADKDSQVITWNKISTLIITIVEQKSNK